MAAEPETPLDAERAFSSLSVASGMKAAFLAFLDQDAVVFRPGPVRARAWFEDRPSPPGTLVWEPRWSSLAASGDLAVNAGPWEYRSSPEGETRGAGHFVSVWRRRDDGVWRVLLDAGIDLRSVRLSGDPVEPVTVFPAAGIAENLPAARESLEVADARLASAARLGRRQAFLAHAAEDALLFRSGFAPARGDGAAEEQLPAGPDSTEWSPAGHDVSRAGDFGFTYGGFSRPSPEGTAEPVHGAYLRVWRRDDRGRWRVVLDVESP